MMKHFPAAYCTLHICFTLLYVIHTEKQRGTLSRLHSYVHIVAVEASESGLKDYH